MLVLPVVVSLLTVASSLAQDKPVSFQDDVWPVLRDRCVACHGLDRQSGGLRLDSRAALVRGGSSGLKLLKLPVSQNELVRRLTTGDKAELMPLGGPALEDAAVHSIVTWLEQGANWPERDVDGSFQDEPGGFESISVKLGEWTRFNKGSVVGILILGMLVLVAERMKKRGSRLASKLRAAHFVAAILGLLLIAVLQHHMGSVRELHAELAGLRSDAVSIGLPEAVQGGDEFGPVPRRPQHPPRLGGVYYRGNDERDPRLYNSGFYCTATFTIELIDDQGNVLEAGSAVTGDLAIRVSIRRGKGTTDAHFSDRAIKSIYLSRQSRLTEIEDVPIPLQVIEPDWFWQATYKPGPPIDGEVRGRLFLFSSSTVRDGTLTGRPHYGIDYNVRIDGGKIAGSSEIWMGSLFQTPRVRQTQPGMIPATEWFDFRPMPEIEGENTTDPKLLGIENPDG